MLLALALTLDLFVYRSPRTATAPTVTAPPPTPAPLPLGIAAVDAVDVGPYSARVVWTTTEPSTATLQWGPGGMVPLLWTTAAHLSVRHETTLDALASDALYAVHINVHSPSGEQATTTFQFRTAAAPTAVSASIADSAVQVNGGAFFPLMTWLSCPDRWDANVAQGIDLFGGNQCTGLPALAAGIAGRALAAGTSDDPVVAAPGLLGWFYPDEADARGLTGAALNPTNPGLHFLTLTQHFYAGAAPLPAGRFMYPDLVAKADVVGFDLYPLQELCRRDFLTAVYDAQQALVALAPGKPTFQWIEVRELKCPTVAVTPATIRAESWLALAGGAHGLGYFPNDWNEQVGAVIAGIDARVRQLEPALLSPALPAQIESSSPDVRASARSFHGARYVFVVNAGTTPATVSVPETTAGTITVGGSAADPLRPLGVRVYVTPPSS